MLRSKTPDGAEQECWALLCAYHALRDVICGAATLTDHDPLRPSFINALDGTDDDPAAFPLTNRCRRAAHLRLALLGELNRVRHAPSPAQGRTRRSLSGQGQPTFHTPTPARTAHTGHPPTGLQR